MLHTAHASCLLTQLREGFRISSLASLPLQRLFNMHSEMK